MFSTFCNKTRETTNSGGFLSFKKEKTMWSFKYQSFGDVKTDNFSYLSRHCSSCVLSLWINISISNIEFTICSHSLLVGCSGWRHLLVKASLQPTKSSTCIYHLWVQYSLEHIPRTYLDQILVLYSPKLLQWSCKYHPTIERFWDKARKTCRWSTLMHHNLSNIEKLWICICRSFLASLKKANYAFPAMLSRFSRGSENTFII